MAKTREEVIAQLQQIMSKTTANGCTAAEAEAALKMAQRLMALHAIELHEVENAIEGEGYAEHSVDKMRDSTLESVLASAICQKFFFVRAYLQTQWEGELRFSHLTFFGTPGNVEAAEYVYHRLRDAFGTLWVTHRKASPWIGKLKVAQQAEERRSFVDGVYAGFSAQLSEDRKQLETEQTASGSAGTALAVIAEKLEAGFKEAHPNLGRGRALAPSRGSAASFCAGHDQGLNLKLSQSVVVQQKALS